jgi:hypothetical protein
LIYSWDIDVNYQTTWNGGVAKGAARGTGSNANFESVGFEINSHANATFVLELFNMYSWSCMLSFIPFDATPYTQTVTWWRPEDYIFQMMSSSSYSYTPNWDLRFSGSYDFHALWFQATVTENYKTVSKSFYDWSQSTSYNLAPQWQGDWAYDPNTVRAYEDTIWQWKPLDD